MLKYVFSKYQSLMKHSSTVVCNFSFNQVGNGQWVALYSQGMFMYNLLSRKNTIPVV